MLMTAMEREQKLEGGAVAIGVEVGVGDFAEVVPVARAGLLAPAAQAESAQLTPQLTPVSDDSVGLSSYPSGLYCRVQTAVFWS